MKLVTYKSITHVVLRETEDFGIKTLELVSPPRRLWGEKENNPATVVANVDPLEVKQELSPAELLGDLPSVDNWSAQSKRSLAKLAALALIAEDPQRRLEAREVVTLAHQVSLVRYILDQKDLRRVLIGDEVGLGKTIEVGSIIKELLQKDPGARVLYLAPARLVSNVGEEFDKLNLSFRQWKANESDARLDSDSRIIASMHRAVHPSHYDNIVGSDAWDIIVVDECHHLSDWAVGGGDPVRKYRLVRDLIAKQRSTGYLFLMSGTPHQGHDARFDNLLALLKSEGETDKNLAGRVIFRTKEDIVDWEGNPLFPRRKVNAPTVVELGFEHDEWLKSIHTFFSSSGNSGSEVARRAAGWKCAQALQWAASSPNAGLGYLVRQAIRADWKFEDDALQLALAAMRPYRLGAADEPIEILYGRIKAEINRQRQGDIVDDLEELSTDDFDNDDNELRDLLRRGVSLVNQGRQPKWEILWDRIIEPAADDKVVLFAQPIETVMALADWITKKTGVEPAIIVGGQSEAERSAQVTNFKSSAGPQFLISSRAGGEGYNLQVSRRLVHLDVPWNPMELEQRVGRVHRFGSKYEIIVDTLVSQGSRETQAWAVARERLDTIARSLVSEDRIETLFSRVMCLIPPDELQSVLIETPVGPLKNTSVSKLTDLIDTGFTQWQSFHEQYSANQKEIRQLDAGSAQWSDLEYFLTEFGGAEVVEGYTRGTFIQKGDSVEFRQAPTSVLKLPDNSLGLAEDLEGGLLTGESTEKVRPLGLNLSTIAQLVRDKCLPEESNGAALLRWHATSAASTIQNQFGSQLYVIAFIRQTIRIDSRNGASEVGCELLMFTSVDAEKFTRVSEDEKQPLLQQINTCSVRIKPVDHQLDVTGAEISLLQDLIRPSDEQIRSGIRFATWPCFAAHIIA